MGACTSTLARNDELDLTKLDTVPNNLIKLLYGKSG